MCEPVSQKPSLQAVIPPQRSNEPPLVNFGSTQPSSAQPPLHLYGFSAPPTPPTNAVAPHAQHIQAGDGEHRKTLLDGACPNPNAEALTTVESMRVAVECHDLPSLRELFALDPTGFRESVNDKKEAFLVRASELGHVALLRFLLNCGANPDIRDAEGRTALLVAVQRQDLSMVAQLLESMANIELRDANHWSPLMHAASSRSVLRFSMVELLLEQWNMYERGINEPLVLNSGEGTYSTALLDVIEAGADVEVVNILLRRGANVDQQDLDRPTQLPLASTIYKQRVDLFQRLMNAGADFRFRDRQRCSALMRVVAQQLAERSMLVADLLAACSYIDQRAVDSWSAQIEDVSKPFQEMLGLLMVRIRDNVNAQDDKGRTVLMDVIEFGGDLALVRSLLLLGAHISLRDDDDWNALMYAASGERSDLVALLVDTMPDINLADESGRTALMDVITANADLTVVKLFLDRGADVRRRDHDGWSPLMHAASMRRIDVIDLLLHRLMQSDATAESGSAAFVDIFLACDSLSVAESLLARSSAFFVLSRGAHRYLVKDDDVRFHESPPSGNGLSLAQSPLMERTALPQAEASALRRQESKQIPAVKVGAGALLAIDADNAHGALSDESTNSQNGLLLVKASRRGDINRVKFLLNCGANPDARDAKGVTALFAAVSRDETDLADLLLAAGADVQLRVKDRRSPLMLAVIKQRVERFEIIMSVLPTGIDLRSLQAWQALMNQISTQSSDMLQRLLNHLPEIDARDAKGRTALINVIDAGADLVTVEALLKRDSNIQLRDHQGWNALMHAAASEYAAEILDALMRHMDLQTPEMRDLQKREAFRVEQVDLEYALAIDSQGGVKRRLQVLDSDTADLDDLRSMRARAKEADELVAQGLTP